MHTATHPARCNYWCVSEFCSAVWQMILRYPFRGGTQRVMDRSEISSHHHGWGLWGDADRHINSVLYKVVDEVFKSDVQDDAWVLLLELYKPGPHNQLAKASRCTQTDFTDEPFFALVCAHSLSHQGGRMDDALGVLIDLLANIS